MNVLHPGFAKLRAFASEELAEPRRARVATHLARCPRCRATVSSIRELRQAVRESTTLPLPAEAWNAVIARRASGETIILPSAPSAAARRRRRSGSLRHGPSPLLRRVAVIALVVGTTGTAFALVPGSPLLGWWERMWANGLAQEAPAAPPPSTPAEADAHAVSVAGMSVRPVNGVVRVSLENPDSLLRIRVRITDSEEAQVSARGAAAAAVFRTGPGRIGIEEAGSGEIVVSLPRGARHGTLLVDGTPFLRTERGRVYVLTPRADTAGAEIVLRIHR